MKSVIHEFIAVYFVLIFFSCINRNNNMVNDNVNIISVDSSLVLNYTMRRAIKECIDYLEAGKKISKDKDLLTLYFDEGRDGNCYLYIFTQSTYEKYLTKGCICLDGYTIVLYDTKNNICGQDLLDLNKFICYSDTLSDIKNVNYWQDGHYDPFGVKYKIVNSDSLLVVYKGMF